MKSVVGSDGRRAETNVGAEHLAGGSAASPSVGERRLVRSIAPWLRQHPDVAGIASVVGLTALVAWDHLQSGRGLYRVDILSQYLPWYTYLGQHLRQGDIPGWLPASLSGSPFAGDPQSGWMYLPVMAIFTVFSGVTGFGVLIVFHLLLAGLSTYLFARILGLSLLGAVVAAAAYEFGPFLERIRCCTIHAEVGAWLPLSLLGVELAVRARSWLLRVVWWAVAGLAVSQMIAGWIGQGAYYGLLATCGYIAYRTLISPPNGSADPVPRSPHHPAAAHFPFLWGPRVGRSPEPPSPPAPLPSEGEGSVPQPDHADIEAPVSSERFPLALGRERGLGGEGGLSGSPIPERVRAALTDIPTTLASLRGPATTRVVACAMHGFAIVTIALGLAAGALWPRFVTVAETNLAGGNYSQLGDDAADTGGWSVQILLDRLLSNDDRLGRWYLGGAVFALAVVAPFLARRRFGVPYFVALSLVPAILTLHQGPLHHLFYLLPRFRQLHQHLPDHVLTVFYLAPALLAGATVAVLQERSWSSRWKATAVAILPLALAGLIDNRLRAVRAPVGEEIELRILPWTLAGIVAVSLLLLAAIWLRPPRFLPVIGVALLLVVLWDPTGKLAIGRLGGEPADAVWSATVTGYTEASGAGVFLQDRRREAAEPFRFFGYDPLIAFAPSEERRTYVSEYRDPVVMALLLNNQAILLGLQDVQGYNPVLLKSYAGLGRAINLRNQSYHYVNILSYGWTSPLLKLLNVHYVVVPNPVLPGRPDLLHLSQRYPTVYADELVRVLAIDDALPRAWIVHDVRRSKRTKILPSLRQKEVDPRQTALISREPPETGQPDDPTRDRATILTYEPERIEIATSTGAAGLLVVSELYHPAWRAYVDGQPVRLYETDRVLRGVPIPAGDHVVELRYDQPSLRRGLLASIATALVVGLVISALAIQRHRTRRPSSATDTPEAGTT
jgi:hypothetical protein